MAALLFTACTKDKGLVEGAGNYPDGVGRILLQKCAGSGCHNSTSKDAAAGLSLSSWEALFEGGRSGPAVIAYRPDYSPLCFFTNTDKAQGPALSPRMPLNATTLSSSEYQTLKDWIIAGAPDKAGRLYFKDRASAQKLYVVNRQCDVVTVVDAGSMQPLRYISVGSSALSEFPVAVKVAPSQRYWLVSFFAPTGLIQKFDAASDELIGQLNLGPGSWSGFDISADSKLAWFIDNSSPGRLACADMETMKVISIATFNFTYPRGICIHQQQKKLYIGTEYGNYIHVVNISDPAQPIVTRKIIDGSSLLKEDYSIAPHYFCLSADGARCFISCEASNDVRVLDPGKDSVIAVVALPSGPAMLQLAPAGNRLFVSCPFDSLSFGNSIGSVNVISANELSLVKTISTGFQPYGLGVSEAFGYVAVANANSHIKGPSPHHVSGCGGRNGYLTFIDLQTLTLRPGKRFELAVYPFDMAVRK